MMDAYQPKDVTKQALQLAGNSLSGLNTGLQGKLGLNFTRRPGKKTLDASQGKRDAKIEVKQTGQMRYGNHGIDLSKVEQLVNIGQTKAIGWMMLYFAKHYADSDDSMIDNLKRLYKRVENLGLDELTPFKMGELALPRIQELAAAINRIRCSDWESD